MKKILLSLFVILIFCSGIVSSREGIEKSLDISAKGVVVQEMRMRIIAENIANVHTTRTEKGIPYKRKDVILKETADSVRVGSIYEDSAEPVKVYDPGHPDADHSGFVYYPNISLSREMSDMAYTSKVYEANIAVYNAAKNMAQAIINLGR